MADIEGYKSRLVGSVGSLSSIYETLDPLSPAGGVVSMGRAMLNSLYPNDFEYYMMSLELVDSRGDRKAFFSFPVMPSSYDQSEPSITNIKKTIGGVSVISNPTFVPHDISIRGNFGRKLRIVVGDNDIFGFDVARLFVTSGSSSDPLYDSSLGTAMKAMKSNHRSAKDGVLDVRIKTGYGAIKALEQICNMDGDIDNYGKMYRLYLYNPAIGNNYLVKRMNLTLSQNKSENIIWGYNLSLKAVAPLEYIVEADADNKGLKSAINATILQTSINAAFQFAKNRVRELPDLVASQADKKSKLNSVPYGSRRI